MTKGVDYGAAPPAITQNITSGMTITTHAPETAFPVGELGHHPSLSIQSSGGGSLIPVDQGVIGNRLHSGDNQFMGHFPIIGNVQIPHFPQTPRPPVIPPLPRVNVTNGWPTTGVNWDHVYGGPVTPPTGIPDANNLQLPPEIQSYLTQLGSGQQVSQQQVATFTSAVRTWINGLLNNFRRAHTM